MMNHSNQNPTQKAHQNPGSVVIGFLIAWAILAIGYGCEVMGFIVIASAFQSSYEASIAWNIVLFCLALLPLLVSLLAIFLARRKDKPKVVKGIIAGIISFFSFALLLLAACYGIMNALSHNGLG